MQRQLIPGKFDYDYNYVFSFHTNMDHDNNLHDLKLILGQNTPNLELMASLITAHESKYKNMTNEEAVWARVKDFQFKSEWIPLKTEPETI